VTCGGGTSTRTRNIARPANNCGKPAEGLDRELRFCNVDIDCTASVDCEFRDWSDWSECSTSCEGVKRRSRQVQKYGRGNGQWCLGAGKQTSPCNPGPNEELPEGCTVQVPQDCKISEWSAWSDCSAECGGGQKFRDREILFEPMSGGKPCNETLEVISECNRRSCSGQPVDCKLGDWQAWGACTKCGGMKRRFRHIEQHPRNGGESCKEDALQEVGVCHHACHGKEQYCTWESWGPWSKCSAKCGNAFRKRKRVLVTSEKPSVDPPAYVQEYDNASLLKLSQLRERSQHLQESHLRELVMSFTCGGLSLVVAFSALRLLRHSRDHTRTGWQRAPAFEESAQEPLQN